jgi:hypothetical protein
MVKIIELLTQIRIDLAADRFKAIDLAREAGLAPTTVYSLLDENREYRTLKNVDAIAEAYQRLTSRIDGEPHPEAASA